MSVIDAASVITLYRDGPADGPENMAADECLANEAVRRAGLVIRLYSWKTTTVSLGAFQASHDAHECSALKNLPLVRRPSGGGAIVHGSDVTYAAAIPRHHPWAAQPQLLYDAFHGAMVESLKARGIRARLAFGETAAEEHFFCFDRRSSGDLVVDLEGDALVSRGTKVMGSAQRRRATAVLQHGSLLIHSNKAVGLSGRHAGLCDLQESGVQAPADVDACICTWLHGLSSMLHAKIDEQSHAFIDTEPLGFEDNLRRFGHARWTLRR
ncbi:MAG: hypothetical protein ABGW78_13015 [Pirellulales bacterium]